MVRVFAGTAGIVAALVWPSPALLAQEPASETQAGVLSVFLDCQTYSGCESDHVTREIPFVNWMRDRRDANVHVLVTSQRTAGGGFEITLAFIGLGTFAGGEDVLRHVSSNTDTQAEMRDAVTRLLKLGLARFLAGTPAAPHLDLVYHPPSEDVPAVAATSADDPWDFWTFRVGGGGYLSGQSQQGERTLQGRITANRTTEALKLTMNLYGNTNRSMYTLSDGTEYVSTTESFSGDVLGAWSLGRHWSAGGRVSGRRSTYSNLDLHLFGGPIIEYDLFPYDQSTRAMVTLTYSLQLSSFNYQDITVTGKLDEILPRHQLGVGAVIRQPWGQIDVSVTGTQYLHDLSVHRIESFGSVTLRLFRGLEFSMFGNFLRIKDQFGLPAVGLTDEEILLSRRARETDYQYYTYFTIGYRFGSKFANVVNPRMANVH